MKFLLHYVGIGMAEAHQAVSYSKLVKHDYRTPDGYEKEYLQIARKLTSKSWKKSFGRMHRKLRNVFYPAHVESFWIILMLVMGIHFASDSSDLVNVVLNILPG